MRHILLLAALDEVWRRSCLLKAIRGKVGVCPAAGTRTIFVSTQAPKALMQLMIRKVETDSDEPSMIFEMEVRRKIS